MYYKRNVPNQFKSQMAVNKSRELDNKDNTIVDKREKVEVDCKKEVEMDIKKVDIEIKKGDVEVDIEAVNIEVDSNKSIDIKVDKLDEKAKKNEKDIEAIYSREKYNGGKSGNLYFLILILLICRC